MPKKSKKRKPRYTARHPNARKIPEGALTKDEALKYLGIAIQTLDYYIKQGIVETYRAGKYRYVTLDSCERLRDLNSPYVDGSGERWLTTREAAELTGLTRDRVSLKCRMGDFDSAKALQRVYVNPASVNAYIERYHIVNGRKTVTINEAAKLYGCTLRTMRTHAYGENSPIESVWKENRRLLYLDSLKKFIDYQEKRLHSGWRLPPAPPANNAPNPQRTAADFAKEIAENSSDFQDISDFEVFSDFDDD